MKEPRLFIRLFILFGIIGLFGLCSSCNPCKFVAKHPECFPADTIRIEKEKISYIDRVQKIDSIIFEKIPCDPVDSFIYTTKVIYRTNTLTKIDTILSDKEVIKVNPINEQLKAKNDTLQSKLENRNRLALYLSIALIIIIAIWWVKSKLKF